jgi:hypothetical protein
MTLAKKRALTDEVAIAVVQLDANFTRQMSSFAVPFSLNIHFRVRCRSNDPRESGKCCAVAECLAVRQHVPRCASASTYLQIDLASDGR